MAATAMKPWQRSEETQARANEFAGASHDPSFRVDARLGYAWFARSAEAKRPVERVPETLPALRRAELVLASQGRAIARRATRIPADAIVALGAALSPGTKRAPAGSGMGQVANDNGPYLSPRARTLLREAFFLLIFGATLAGTYYLGRMHAFHNVIVVPDSVAHGHRVV
jgi:hypothetical protein